MKLFISIVIAALALSGAIAYSSLSREDLQPGVWTIRVTVKTVKVTGISNVETFQQLVYNRRISKHPIGNVITVCEYLGRGGLLGSGLRWCEGSMILPHGRITFQGRHYHRATFLNSVVGGTGLYRNVGGELSGTITAEGEEQLLFELVAFS